jgi:electron transport complex protein RnfG
VGLAFVYSATQKTIAERSRTDLEAALKELFPEADGFDDISGSITSPEATVSFGSEYAVKQGGRIIGAALQSSGGSYGGVIRILVGVNAGGTISRIKIMEHSDTPGFGANAVDPSYYVNAEKKITFPGQFDGKPVGDAFEPKNDVIAISGATITSRAVSTVVKTAGRAAEEWLDANGEKK